MDITSKTTHEHYQLFKDNCLYWIKKFGLLDIEIVYKHEGDSGDRGHCYYNMPGRIATLVLETMWTNIEVTENAIKDTAFHEVLELLLGDLVWLAEARYVTPDSIDAACHRVIRVIENVMYPILIIRNFRNTDTEDKVFKEK